MKSLSRLFIFTLFVVSFAASAMGQATGQPVTQTKLISELNVNGLKVIVKQRPGAATVSAGLFVRGGVKNLTPQTAGLETLTLSVATEASKKFPRDVMRRELSRMGSTLGSGSNQDFSVISLSSTRENFDRTWEIFADAVVNPAFAPFDVEQMRERLLTGLRNQTISPDLLLNVQEERIVYANHPYAVDPNGTIETVTAFKADDLRNYHKNILQTSRLLLVVVGDVDPVALEKRVAAAFGALPKGDYKDKPVPPLSFDKPTLDITQRSVETNYVKGVFAAPSLSNPDYYAMRVALALLQSRVYQEVRVKRNLSYAPNAEMDDFAANTANIYVTAVDANQSVSVMLREIDKMKTALVDEEDFTGIPGYFLTTYFVKQETNAAQVAELARYELIGGGWRDSVTFLEKIRAVSRADVRSVSEKYMKNLRFVVVGNPTAINRSIFLGN